ncbi:MULTISPECIES: class I SAM-dependent methyltransferase [Crocosphaera]|uniref:3-demethylubiquinone-9 3-methyltransferase n=1 Tax=Crocosphaera watsonii WH 0003 TaxID=423471 RepID=G5J049_CROWT|nr:MULTISPECIES: class I SAM-dependent methyltransferase [Crocosphaera]EHJ14418.1 3-demethylubiquinone-9 3-methyltransferase [Crocosphaera watsonii WH 0003]MCH2245507.1 class I SAM-dependent methyltransferase [Crocosphaera sp.]
MTKFSPESAAVQQLYNTYPFPPEPLLDEPPPGYNWRWNWIAAYNFCTGRKPERENIRILDAGCGTGVGTEYLILLNPHAEIVGVDISEKALEIAQKRSQQSGVATNHNHPISFHHLPLENADQIEGEFDLINCVGVLHHLPDPMAGIKALSKKLAPGGIFHIFVYAELGRWEIQLMQKAISLLQTETKGDYKDGVFVGRKIFDSLPENNRLVKREKEKWSLENHRDESFADMYVHPQETDYNIDTLFELIEASGLEFIGFSNPQYWDLKRLIGESEDLMKRTENLSDRQRYRLTELLDPENITHYEFFLGKPPLVKIDWSEDETLLSAIPEVHPCSYGWPSQSFLNYDYQPVSLSDAEYNVMQGCDGKLKVKDILNQVSVDLEMVRSLQQKQLIILTPNSN